MSCSEKHGESDRTWNWSLNNYKPLQLPQTQTSEISQKERIRAAEKVKKITKYGSSAVWRKEDALSMPHPLSRLM